MTRTAMLGFLAATLGWVSAASGQIEDAPRRPYDGLQAGKDAYNLAEEQRRNRVAEQAGLNDAFRDQAAWRPVYGEDVTYYRGASGYRYGGYGGYGGYQYRETTVITPGFSSGVVTVGPGPYVGAYRPLGLVTGYVRDPTIPFIRQPIGQRQIQTGPNRWESHPVYGEDPPDFRAGPPVAESDPPVYERTSPPVRPKIITPPREY